MIPWIIVIAWAVVSAVLTYRAANEIPVGYELWNRRRKYALGACLCGIVAVTFAATVAVSL